MSMLMQICTYQLFGSSLVMIQDDYTACTTACCRHERPPLGSNKQRAHARWRKPLHGLECVCVHDFILYSEVKSVLYRLETNGRNLTYASIINNVQRLVRCQCHRSGNPLFFLGVNRHRQVPAMGCGISDWNGCWWILWLYSCIYSVMCRGTTTDLMLLASRPRKPSVAARAPKAPSGHG